MEMEILLRPSCRRRGARRCGYTLHRKRRSTGETSVAALIRHVARNSRWNSRLKMHVPWNLVTMRSRVYASRRNTFIIPPRSDQLNRIPRINRETLFLPPILNIRSTTFFFLN